MLVSVDRYRLITGDSASAASAVSAAVEEATDLLSEELGWSIESAQRTESLPVVDGRLYPAAVPITVVPDGFTVDGYSVLGSGAGSLPVFLVERSERGGQRTSLTYTGGWTDETLPASLRRAICWAAYTMVRPGDVAELIRFAGASSVSLGDASVDYTVSGPTKGVPAGGTIRFGAKAMGWHLKHRRVVA